MNLWQVAHSLDLLVVELNTASCRWTQTHGGQNVKLVHADAADFILDVHLWNGSTQYVVGEIGAGLLDDIEVIL